MIRNHLFTIAFFSLWIAMLPTQVSANENLVPRKISIVKQNQEIPDMLMQILYARLTLQVPLINAGPDVEPDNTITLKYDNGLQIILEDKNTVIDTRELPDSAMTHPIKTTDFFDSLAKDWTPMLDLIPPNTTERYKIQFEEMQTEVTFEGQLPTPFQVTLWSPLIIHRVLLIQLNYDSQWALGTPVRTDFSWYFIENIGLTASFTFEYDENISFARGNFNIPKTKNLMLTPGIGIQVRTIGRLSVEINLSVYFGAVHVTADDGDTVVPELSKGESTWIFYPFLGLDAVLIWSITPQWSMKVRLFEFDFALRTPSEVSNNISLKFIQIGVSYRW